MIAQQAKNSAEYDLFDEIFHIVIRDLIHFEVNQDQLQMLVLILYVLYLSIEYFVLFR